MPERQGGSRRSLLYGLSGALLLVPLSRAAAADAVVEIHNFAFHPAELRVTRGTTVSWMNRDDSPHSIVLAEPGVRSPAMDTGGRFAHRFDRAGTFDYRCGLHPHMQGKVIVS